MGKNDTVGTKGTPTVRAWSNVVKRHELQLGEVDALVLRGHPEILAALGTTT